MADPITSNLEVDVTEMKMEMEMEMEMKMEMESHSSIFKAAEEYGRCILCHLDSTLAFSAIKQYLAQYETQRRKNELKQFCGEYMYAVADFWEIVSSFLEVIDIDEQNSKGYTALTLMADIADTEMTQKFIDAGANINNQEINGYTALMLASIEGHTEIVDILIEAGADVNIQDEDGMTALMIASEEGHKETVEMLIDAKADLNIIHRNGVDTALKLAIYNGNTAKSNNHIDIAKMLIEAGAEEEEGKDTQMED